MPLKNKTVQDSIFIFLCGAALLWYSLAEHYGGPAVEWKMSPSLFPVLVAVFLLFLAASLLSGGLRELNAAKGGAGKQGAPGKTRLVLVSAVLSAAYFIVMRFITFIPATILFLAVFIFMLGERRYWLIALVAVLSSLAVYAIFGLALGVMLP